MPVFESQPLITTDESGKTCFNMVPAFALVASLTLTLKDVYRFAVDFEVTCDSANPGEQVLQMSDHRFADMRALYRVAVLEFLKEYLPKQYIHDHQIPFAHLATVLLKLHKDRETAWESCKEGKDPLTLTQAQKTKTPVLILNALDQGAFLHLGKMEPAADQKTFLLAVPGYDVRQVPAVRNKGIEDAFKSMKTYQDGFWLTDKQKVNRKTIEKQLGEVMQGLKDQFEETLKKLWPEFNYKKRAIAVSPERLFQEFDTFKVGPTIQKQKRKLSSSRYNVSPQILTGSLKVPNAEGKLDPPQPDPEIQVIDDPDYVEPPHPIPEVLVIEDPVAAPEEKANFDSSVEEEDIEHAHLEDALSEVKPLEQHEQSQPEEAKSQSQLEKAKSQSQPEKENSQSQPEKEKSQSAHEQSQPENPQPENPQPENPQPEIPQP
jgi:hypothetical protein